MNKVQNSG